MEQADVVLYLFDASAETPASLQQELERLRIAGKPLLAVANKTDLLGDESAHSRFAGMGGLVFISARQERHLEILKERLTDLVMQGKTLGEGTTVTNARHYHALRQVDESLDAIRRGLDEGLPGDLLSPDIRRCLHYLGEITGEISNEDQLDYIFSKFCIGK
jgi:tRNA modification GTPase